MLIEYYLDTFLNNQEVKETLQQIKAQNIVSSILINQYQYRSTSIFFHPNKINIHIDFPLGISTTSDRLRTLENVVKKYKSGIISLQTPANFLINRKYDQIRKEIFEVKNIIPDDIKIRYILEYRKYNYNALSKFCDILIHNNIDTIYPSTTFFLDNIYDNIIAGKYLEKQCNIKSIFNGNIWTKEHIDLMIKSECSHMSVQHLPSLKLLKTQLYGNPK
jgi:deoxyribose-phosphate aldolase